MNILFIAYHYAPSSTVGAKRVSFWAKHLQEISPESQYHILTATKQTEDDPNITYIADNQSSFFSFIIKDEGITWAKSLCKTLTKDFLSRFDFVIFTGGPFMHFQLAKHIKAVAKCKIVFDFRDPFYNNPRFNSSKLKDRVKKSFQDFFLKYADLVLTVNQHYQDSINFPILEVIENGYDDELISDISNASEINNSKKLLLVGKIYNDILPDTFLNSLAIHFPQIKLNYIGDYQFNSHFKDLINHLGKKSHEEVMKYISQAEICLLFTGGKSFESPTKVYEYLALEKKILIITEGELKTGAIYDLLMDYPNVIWSKNNEADIKTNLTKILQLHIHSYDTKRFSRKSGLKKLIKLLNDL
ncbi:MAG: hypothetical protein QF441_03905 [Bacteriovoracaceae bacterium]|jgi:hypothetical protein|nr:hypothetical protein [Bacteriovoracaceae bacterium]